MIRHLPCESESVKTNNNHHKNSSLGIPEKVIWVAELSNIPPRRLMLKGPFMLCLVESVATLSLRICVCQQQILAKLAFRPGSNFAYPGLLEQPSCGASDLRVQAPLRV